MTGVDPQTFALLCAVAGLAGCAMAFKLLADPANPLRQAAGAILTR